MGKIIEQAEKQHYGTQELRRNAFPIRQDGLEYTLYSEPIKWDYSGLETISLWQLMDYFRTHDFLEVIREVYAFELSLKRRCEEGTDWYVELPNWDDPETNELLKKVTAVFVPKDFPHTLTCVTRVYSFANSKCTYQELWMRVTALRETMEDELRGRKLLLVPGLKTEYCDRKDLFGQEVFEAFPSAEDDIKEAGNSYAVGLHTACVFHLMRVLECGLRVLADDLGVVCEVENWGRFIEKIEGQIKIIRELGRKSPQFDRVPFYSECAVEFGYFKDAWRNHVMHARRSYSENESKKIMEHVENFMRRLAREVQEGTT